MASYPFTKTEWDNCIKVLKTLKNNPLDNPDNQTFKTLVTSIYKIAKKQINAKQKESSPSRKLKRLEDNIKIKQTKIIANALSVTTDFWHQSVPAEPFETLNQSLLCYSCKQDFKQLHFFYHKLCPNCANDHYERRQRTMDLSGHRIIVTGGRVKIGYATALKCLKAGAEVIVTSRFPAITLNQFEKEIDYDNWKQRLTVYGLDLRHLPSVQAFLKYVFSRFEGLELLINNAAQTIKYTSNYYTPLLHQEQHLLLNSNKTIELIPNTISVTTETLSLSELDKHMPVTLNRFNQPIDERIKNSWNASLHEVGLEELLEVNLINHISPYVLISELKPLFLSSSQAQRFIINVTSSEGQFSYPNKTAHHPHTNMTKAALNMLTRTSAQEFIKDNIYMNAVDVGWISTGAHEAKRQRLFDQLMIPPLDSVDGAARIFHPIIAIKEGDTTLYGKLLKNYKIVEW
jgi:NAD(P)-dependent dehydrogenase (short-subunit alcohol dehydrogenase family)